MVSLLATPASAEAQRAELAQQLENYLTPLVAYCEAQRADDNLSTADFRHGYQVREAIDAVLRYDAATEALLAHYRTALATVQAQAQAAAPTLEHALLCQLPPAAQRAYREADPVYRLGFSRGQRHVADLYAHHDTRSALPDYVPSALEIRVAAHAAQPHVQARLSLSVADRQALATVTGHHLPHPHAGPRKT